jgi:multidrug efflux pump subunit AcrB
MTPNLPTWASPPFMMPPLSATSRILKIGLSSDTVNLTDMSTIAYWKIRARLLRVPGVAQVAIWGERLPQRHIQVDPKKLAEHDVTLQNVMDAAADSVEAGLLRYSDGAVVGTGGFVETSGQRFNVRHVQPIFEPDQLGQVPVAERDGKVIRLGDLGNVLVDPGPLIGDGVVDDGPGLLLVVQKFRGANTVEVTRGVEEAMREMQPGLPGITVDTTIFRPATFIEQSLDNLRTAMLLGIALVVLIIVAFLFEWRTAFISLIAIPLSLVAAYSYWTPRVPRSTSWSWQDWWLPSGWWWTTPSSTWRTWCDGFGKPTLSAAERPPSVSCSTPRSRSARRSPMPP